ncbi:hypothetical protein QUF50_06810 [Thiotrichales bacterium HSG1]|nr:hypothetical protein [Thiotrichales bacterium HSG1]
MDAETKAKIESYLADEALLYQTWYDGFGAKSTTYTKQVGPKKTLSELKYLFLSWMDKLEIQLQQSKLCEVYCNTKAEAKQTIEVVLIFKLTNELSNVIPDISSNYDSVLATATALVITGILSNLCKC